MELIFAVGVDGERRAASVIARRGRRPSFTFPHNFSELGESLGTDLWDQALIRQAETICALWEGQRIWARADAA